VDADPCTIDLCLGRHCSNQLKGGFAGVDCEFGLAMNAQLCGAEHVPASLRKFAATRMQRARGLLHRAEAVKNVKRKNRLVRRAMANLLSVVKRAKQVSRKGKISLDCKTSIVNMVSGLRNTVNFLITP